MINSLPSIGPMIHLLKRTHDPSVAPQAPPHTCQTRPQITIRTFPTGSNFNSTSRHLVWRGSTFINTNRHFNRFRPVNPSRPSQSVIIPPIIIKPYDHPPFPHTGKPFSPVQANPLMTPENKTKLDLSKIRSTIERIRREYVEKFPEEDKMNSTVTPDKISTNISSFTNYEEQIGIMHTCDVIDPSTSHTDLLPWFLF